MKVNDFVYFKQKIMIVCLKKDWFDKIQYLLLVLKMYFYNIELCNNCIILNIYIFYFLYVDILFIFNYY